MTVVVRRDNSSNDMKRAPARGFWDTSRASMRQIMASTTLYRFLETAVLCSAAVLMSACTRTAITPEATSPDIPAGWQHAASNTTTQLDWLGNFDDAVLRALVAKALDKNYAVNEARASLARSRQAVVIAGADRFPELSLTVDSIRRDSGSLNTESSDISVEGRWDLDLWGRLSQNQQAARLAFAAQEMSLRRQEQSLTATTVQAYFNTLEAAQLLEVAQRRLENAKESEDIVASGYRQGLNDALDLYLAKNQLEREQANLAQQQQALTETVADLQLLIADYPDGKMALTQELPALSLGLPVGLPSELLARRPDIQQAWFNLLSADATLAAAHKARFPSLVLVGSRGESSAEFSELLSDSVSVWSIAGSLSQTLFNAGRLKALEAQAFAQVQSLEQQYLGLVYQSFATVENSISRAASLRSRYAAFVEAEKNSRAALNLALQQYQRGLVPYTTVLESQRQAFDAESTVVQLKNQLLQNRVGLYLALGGEFLVDE